MLVTSMSSPKRLARLIDTADLTFKFKYVKWSPRLIVKRQQLFIYTSVRTCSYMYVTMVYWRIASQGLAQKTHFDHIVRGHFETETSKSETGTTYSRFRCRNRWNRCSFIHNTKLCDRPKSKNWRFGSCQISRINLRMEQFDSYKHGHIRRIYSNCNFSII